MAKVVRPNPKYSLAMIVRDCATELEKCLASFGKYPDELVIVNTGINESEKGFKETNAVAAKYNAKILHFPWCEDFAAARNFSFANCTHDFVMWLDSDDTIDHPELADKNIRVALSEGCDMLTMEYLYEFDADGNCTAVQPRERVVAKNSFEWRAPIHEVLCATRKVTPATLPPEIARVVHDRRVDDIDRQRKSQRRNYKVFIEQFEKKGIEPELRMLFYWGNTCMGLGDNSGAIAKYERYLERSEKEGNGNDAEVIQACVGLSEAYCNLNDLDNAERVALFAVAKLPFAPTPWFCLARVAVERRDWNRVASYSKRVLECGENMDMQLVSNPRELVGRPHWFLAMAAAAIGQYEVGLEYAEKAVKWFSTNPLFKEFHFQLRAAVDKNKTVASWIHLRDKMIREGRAGDISLVAPYVPREIREEIIVNGFTKKVRPKDKPTLAIMCPSHPSLKPWGPDSISKGIGGSEEAVINMVREMSSRGWFVEVYANTGRACAEGPLVDSKTGAHWYKDTAWSGKFDNKVDVAVSWRSPPVFQAYGKNADQAYLWLHDIPNPAAWNAGVEDDYDGIFLLSKYHRSLHKFVDEKKVIYSENGLDPSIFVPLDDLTNDPHRLVWGSDPSRGLQYLLPWWGYIKEQVPDATLDVFYGWTNIYLEGMKQDERMLGIYNHVEKLRNQEGITWHGMVDQAELAKTYAKSGVWPYMTTFPEIHCITALKMQAHGVLPVTVDDFALSETVQFGDKLPGPMSDQARQKALVDRIIDRMKNPPSKEERLEMARWARSKTWASVADQWDSLFRSRMAQKTPMALSSTQSST